VASNYYLFIHFQFIIVRKAVLIYMSLPSLFVFKVLVCYFYIIQESLLFLYNTRIIECFLIHVFTCVIIFLSSRPRFKTCLVHTSSVVKLKVLISSPVQAFSLLFSPC
jgi:hypothetical protein